LIKEQKNKAKLSQTGGTGTREEEDEEEDCTSSDKEEEDDDSDLVEDDVDSDVQEDRVVMGVGSDEEEEILRDTIVSSRVSRSHKRCSKFIISSLSSSPWY